MKVDYEKITKKNTKTFYYSAIFFPKKIRENVFLLYSFVRMIDNFIDKKTPDKKNFYLYKKNLLDYLKKNQKSKIKIINDFGELVKKFNLKKEITDYLNTQEKELFIKKYKTFDQFNNFIYGVAGTIGIMMAKILKLPSKLYNDAKNFGESLQIINNVRDIWEDYKRGKVYIPEKLLKKYNLNYKNFIYRKNLNKLKLVINDLLKISFNLAEKSKKSFIFFDKKVLIPIKIAGDIYFDTAKKIEKNPELIFKKKNSRPSLLNIIFIIIKNYFQIYGFNKKD